jgi:hypothetical protein
MAIRERGWNFRSSFAFSDLDGSSHQSHLVSHRPTMMSIARADERHVPSLVG